MCHRSGSLAGALEALRRWAQDHPPPAVPSRRATSRRGVPSGHAATKGVAERRWRGGFCGANLGRAKR
jgi:hypothetical protein